MRWLLFSYELNAIVKQCDELLQVAGQAVMHDHHRGTLSLQDIKEKINKYKPDRIIVIDNQGNFENNHPLHKILNDHLLIPIYVGQATIHLQSPIPVLLLTFTNDNNNIDSILSVNIVQNATNELINLYSNMIHAKIYTPISDEDLNETILLKYLNSLWKNDPEETHHITILSDILPILLALIHDGKVQGQVNVSNKGKISLNCLERLISNQSKTTTSIAQIINTEDLIDQFEKWNKEMILPETRHLYQASFVIPNAPNSIVQYLQQNSINRNSNAPRIVLATGGCGFIGSTFINHWLEKYPEDQIINIDRLDPVSNIKNIQNSTSPNYSLVVADIDNKDIILHLMKQYNITHIVHFAVQAHLDNSFGNSITFTQSNVSGTHSVLEASRLYGRIVKFIHISTDEVNSETAPGSYQETGLLNPMNPYAATVAAAEFLVKSYGDSFKLSYCIVRLCNVYGPRQHIEKLIPIFINNLSNGQTLKIHGDGKQTRNYIYVDDVVNAIEIIFHQGKTKMVYNIGTEYQLSILDIAKSLIKKIQPNKNPEDIIIYDKPRSFTDKRYSSITNSAVKTLAWKPKVSFDEGLDKTIQWYKQNPKYWDK
ncbi:unnamed protein product [Rotaria sp. Silwood2]|nr:unnamed protein product [Rotaria sp. Silwood2]CAF2624264.1 unnamed protein product [Rotaria sp. Silwood2]CAF3048193.1 unnamed protein product [Rotaria sp. Silwood2]CAF4423543.1 unnamed protein product [Rotaria sp. Silwood2]